MIRIHTLGGLSVGAGDGKPLAGPAIQPRRLAVLALLARAGERAILRDKLLAFLWPDADSERGPRALAQALYALRKNLDSDDAITGAKELRLNPELVSSDVSEFASAVSRGDHDRAVALYQGPFLDGFSVPGLDEFSQWAEGERASIAAEHSRALESLARAARSAGDSNGSVAWWRKLAAIEPLNARVAIGLMDALAAAGDPAGAVQHARIYEVLVDQELDLPPDREVLDLAARLRRVSAGAAPSPSPESPPSVELASAEVDAATVVDAVPEPSAVVEPAAVSGTTIPRRSRISGRMIGIGITAVAVVGAALGIARGALLRGASSANAAGQVVAIGNIKAFGADSAGTNLTSPAADLLTTNLARVEAIRVVSHGRILELMQSLGAPSDTSAAGFLNAARQVGATEIVDGTLYARPGGRLRLDLRRVNLASGAIGGVYTVEGNDLFAVVDSGTARLVSALGGSAPGGSVADVTTRSVTAYRMYEQGVRAYYRGDIRTSHDFFNGALAEDSLFALAAYYAALTEPIPRFFGDRMERARRLAARASDRERLMILVGWAGTVSSPSLRALAETLATRYPAELEGHLYSGIARVVEGDFLAAIPPLERVVAMDSLGLNGTRPRCSGCDALGWIVGSYSLADSLPAAEREARRWLRLQPNSGIPGRALASILEIEGRSAEADSIFQAHTPLDRSHTETMDFQAFHLIRAGDYAEADRMLRAQLREPELRQQINALWDLTMSLREQGRLAEAVDAAHRARAPLARTGDSPEGALPILVVEAIALFEAGRPAAAAAVYDSLAQQSPNDAPSRRARNAAWMLTHAAGARVAAGDTSRLGQLADSIRSLGAESGYGRDQRLYHHVRGLLLAARGDDAGAIAEFKAAIYSINAGYTRTNYEMGRVYLRDQRPRDAVAILQPALRGPLDASNLYLNRIELHELLAQAWDAAGGRDSAATHYKVVAGAWAAADPLYRARAAKARARLDALTAGR